MGKWRFLKTHPAGAHEEAAEKGREEPEKSCREKPEELSPRVQFEFTGLDLTAFGGASVLAQTAQQFGLFELLDGAVSVKVRNRGGTDVEMLWSIIASLARGHGSLSHLDALRADPGACILPGLGQVPERGPPTGQKPSSGRLSGDWDEVDKKSFLKERG